LYFIKGCNASSEEARLTAFKEEVKKELNQQFEAKMLDLNKRLDGQDSQIKRADQKIRSLSVDLTNLKKEKENVQKPKDHNERYNRLNALGLKPIR
jgi:multidrug resistance efflux pump